MEKILKEKLTRIFIVPAGLSIVLIPFSILIGWNLLTLFLFWFVVIPGLTIYLPAMAFGNKRRLFDSLTGLVIFYAIMVLMIYDHYRTDYFQVMVLSGVLNLILIPTVTWVGRQRARK
jgi:hypothetical protein